MKETWDELNLFCNRDLLERAYQSRHQNGLSAGKARQIIASIEQGREYFTASQNVTTIAQPLLLYYGVLALSRAVILFSVPNSKEESLSQSHGLETVGWADTLAGNLKNVMQLKMRINNGTFSELVLATGNVENYAVHHDFMRFKEITTAPTEPLPTGFVLSLEDIMARIPQLSSLYERIFQKNSECFEAGGGGGVMDYDKYSFTFVAYTNGHSIDEFKKIIRIQDNDVNTEIKEYDENGRRVWYTVIQLKDMEGIEPKIIPSFIEVPGSGTRIMIWPMDNRYYLSTLSRLYLLSYSLGMLGRYFPSSWMSGVSLETGTSSFPILKKAVDVIYELYPAVILKELQL